MTMKGVSRVVLIWNYSNTYWPCYAVIHQNYPWSLVYIADYNQEIAKKFSGKYINARACMECNIANQKYIKL